MRCLAAGEEGEEGTQNIVKRLSMIRRLAPVMLATLMVLAGCTGTTSTSGTAGSQPSRTTTATSPSSTTAPFARIPEVVRSVKPSVVTIRTQKGLGSGVVYSSGGVIVTNRHVVARGSGRQAQLFNQVTVVFATGKKATGRVLAGDYRTDLAVVRVDRDGLRAADFQTKPPTVGELAVALGSPLGFTESVTAGVISGLNRRFPASRSNRPLVNLIQTDAPISPGSSGGALVDQQGQVVGINELYVPPEKGAVSLGFAIPSATVVDVVQQILENGDVQHAFIGIRPGKVTRYIAKELGLNQTSAVLVRQVVQGSGAAEAGIRGGDVITRMAGTKIQTVAGLYAELRQHAPGDTVTITLIRDGQQKRVQVTLTDRPSSG